MKKLIAILLVVSVLFAFASCGGNETEGNINNNDVVENNDNNQQNIENNGVVNNKPDVPAELTADFVKSYPVTDASQFEVSETPDGIAISNYTGLDEIVVIPEEINGKPVIEIQTRAFVMCDSLKAVKLSDSIKEIGDEAFVFCKAISVINIPNFINKIGAFAFNHCKSLKTLTMPNTVNEIGDGVFAGCSLLKDVDFSEDNENFVIIDNILYNKTERTVVSCFSDKKNIVIPAGIERICKKAFAYCDSIYSVSIPNSVKLIDDSAFFQCKSLAAVKIPYSVTKLGDEAFASCKLLSSIYVPDSVITIGNNVFNDYNLKFFVVHCGLESCAEQYCKKII